MPPNHLQPPDNCRCIGCIQRLNDILPLCIENRAQCHIAIQPNTWLMVGDIIGTIAETPDALDSLPNADTILSPSDGFLICHQPDGNPMVMPDSTLHPGAVIAIIELMKIRMDVVYEGPNDARFAGYIGTSPRPVHRGDPIARIDIQAASQGSPMNT